MLAAFALAAFQLAHAAPHVQPVPLPVHVVDSGGHPGGRSPLMVVGSLFTGGHCYREDDGNRIHATPQGQIVMPARFAANKYSHVMTEFSLGNVRPRPGTDEEETLVFLTSPPLENGHEFTIDRLEVNGTTFIVHASHWFDDIKHEWSPGARRDAHLLRLGWLPPGEYTCRLMLTRRFMSAQTPRPGIYTAAELLTGETKFTVAKGDPWHFHSWDQAPSTAVVREESLAPMRFEKGVLQQPPYYAVKRPDAAGQPDEDRIELVLTAPLDWRKHSQADATLWETPHNATADAVLVARVTGGKARTLGRHDWAEITSIQWTNQDPAKGPPEVTIHAAVWRRSYIDGNAPTSSRPAFVVPIVHEGLGSAKDLAQSLRVTVAWTEGSDNPRGAVLEIRR